MDVSFGFLLFMTYDIIPTGFIYMQEKAKQYPVAELLLFECYSLSLCILSIQANMRYSKKYAKHKCFCFNVIIS